MIFDQNKPVVYCSNIKEDKLHNIYSRLLTVEVLDNIGNQLNALTEGLSELLVQSAEETFGAKYVSKVNNINNVQRKKQFDSKCHLATKTFLSVKHLKLCKTDENRAQI